MTRYIGWVVRTAVVGLLVAGCGSSSPATLDPKGARAASGFEQSAEDWTVTGDAQASSVKADFNGTGGNPDGLISAVDDVTGGTWYFQAPAKYLGDASATYGKSLQYDLKTTDVSDPFDNFDVILSGASKVLVFKNANNPAVDLWTSYNVPLSEAGWRVITAVGDAYPDAFTDLPAASQADFKAVLANITQLLIRGEFNSGPDTGFLDNVRFGATP